MSTLLLKANQFSLEVGRDKVKEESARFDFLKEKYQKNGKMKCRQFDETTQTETWNLREELKICSET